NVGSAPLGAFEPFPVIRAAERIADLLVLFLAALGKRVIELPVLVFEIVGIEQRSRAGNDLSFKTIGPHGEDGDQQDHTGEKPTAPHGSHSLRSRVETPHPFRAAEMFRGIAFVPSWTDPQPVRDIGRSNWQYESTGPESVRDSVRLRSRRLRKVFGR